MGDLCSIFNKLTGCETPEGIGSSKDPKARYSRITVSLDEAFTDKEYYLAGSYLGVVSVTGGASCKIKLDYTRSGVIDLREIESIHANFNKLYITTDGTGGDLILYICQSMVAQLKPETKNIYTGMIYNGAGATVDNVQRLLDSSFGIHFSQLIIRNAETLRDAEIGHVPFTGDPPERAEFLTTSFRLLPKMQTTLVKVNAAGIGFCSTGAGLPAELKIIGTIA
jgi:hypothetical protein